VDLITAIAALPPDALVPVGWIREIVASDVSTQSTAVTDKASVSVDMTVAQVATRFGKGESTVRAWLARGELPGSYRLHGHEWRIPSGAVAALQRSQSSQHAQRSTAPKKSRQAVDVGEWRRHTRATRSLAVQP